NDIVTFLKKSLQLENNTVSATLLKDQHIGIIQGIAITKEEIQREMRKYRAEVYGLVSRENKIKNTAANAVWSASTADGTKTIDRLRQQAIDSVVAMKVQEKMLTGRNLWPYSNCQEFLTDLKKYNANRGQMAANDQILYGP